MDTETNEGGAAAVVFDYPRRDQAPPADLWVPAHAGHAPVRAACVDWLAAWLPEARQRRGAVLELAAGVDPLARRAWPWQGRYLATDAAADRVAAARVRYPALDWAVAAPGDTETPPGPWAWIFANAAPGDDEIAVAREAKVAAAPGVVHAAPTVDDEATRFRASVAALRAWRRQLAPEGRVLAAFPVAESLPELRGLWPRRPPALRGSARAWREAFEAAGLWVTRDDTLRLTVRYGSALSMLRSLREAWARPVTATGGTGAAVAAAPAARVSPARWLAWLRARGAGPVTATWVFYRCEAVAAELG